MSTGRVKNFSSWKKISGNATQTLTVPTTANEVVIDLHAGNGSVGYSFFFLGAMLDQTVTYNQGYEYGTALRNNVAGMRVNNRAINVMYFYNDSTDYKISTSVFNIYWR